MTPFCLKYEVTIRFAKKHGHAINEYHVYYKFSDDVFIIPVLLSQNILFVEPDMNCFAFRHMFKD